MIRQEMDKCPSKDNHLYLIKSIDDKCGFFAMDKRLLFMARTESVKRTDTVKTEKLLLNTCVDILNVENDSTFKPGKYDFILFTGEKDETDFESFVNICVLYSNEKDRITVKDFFYSILDMFQLPKEQQFKNLIGLMGELAVLYDIYIKTGVNVASGWHENSTDKYDISYNGSVIEVKTTTSNLYNVKIKHDQLFGKEGVILAAVRVTESNAGVTLKRLIKKINDINDFKTDFIFQIKLGKELKKISPKDLEQKKIEIKDIRFYCNSDMITIYDIPENITNVEYEYMLIDTPTREIKDILN